MKVINQICRFLTLVLGLGALVLFFFPFVTLPVGSTAVDVTGAQLAFGTTVDVAGKGYNLYLSSYILLTFIFAAFATIMAGVAAFVKKAKNARIASFVSSLVAGILMLVIALSKVTKFADIRPLAVDATAKLTYAPIAIITSVVIFACFIVCVAGWLVDDYLEVLASKGQKLTIWQKIVKFIRENIAEIKKIIWPGPKTVLRNSGIVLALCVLLGAFIWIVDFLLGRLVNFITTL